MKSFLILLAEVAPAFYIVWLWYRAFQEGHRTVDAHIEYLLTQCVSQRWNANGKPASLEEA